MKAGLFTLAAAALLQIAVGQPHGIRQQHRHHRRQAVVTDVDYVVEEVVVYVDEQGAPVSTETVFQGMTATSTSSSSSSSTTSSTTTTAVAISPDPPAAVPTTLATSTSASTPAAPAASSPAPVVAPVAAPVIAPIVAPSPSPKVEAVAAPAASSSSSSSSSSQGPGFSSAISYSPYQANGLCKTSSQVTADFVALGSFSVVRLYNSDCSGITNVMSATKGKNVQIFAGVMGLDKNNVYSSSVVQSQLQDLITQVNGDWSVINTVSVGNELVNGGKASPSQVIADLSASRSTLRAKGYNGPVVTVDTMIAVENNIQLCLESDYCAINCHAFYDGGVLPSGAGQFVLNFVKKISAAAGGKTTVVTESGWPSKGSANGVAIPSVANQQTAMSSLKSTFSTNLIQYTAYNNLWLTSSSDSTISWWGVYGTSAS